MHLSRVYIRNFRSIKEMDLSFSEGKNVLVGKNNSGKSNIIRAINLVLGEFNPAYQRSEIINPGDFYAWTESTSGDVQSKQANDIFIWCELTRMPGETLDIEAIKKAANGYYVYKHEDGLSGDIRPKKLEKELIPEDDDEIFRQENQKARGFIRATEYEDELSPMHSFSFAFQAIHQDDGTIERNMRFLYRESPDHDWTLAFSVPFRNELLQSALIPSFRDPASQLRLTNSTWYGRLINHLTKSHARNPELIAAISKVSSISTEIFGQVTKEVGESALEIAFPGTKLEFAFNTEREEDLYKSAVIYIDDGFRSQLPDKGSGIQSATIIGLFNYYVRHVNTIASALLCIEEPELYLHPHARRVINNRLDDFLDGNRNQVLISTHSTEFLSSNSDFNVVVVSKKENGTAAKPINVSTLRQIMIDASQNELFFADKIVLAEGYDAHLLRTILSFTHPGQLNNKNVTIVIAGGKDQIPSLAQKLSLLEVPVYVFADFDFLLRDQAADALNDQRNQSVVNLGEAYFSSPFMFGSEGVEIYKKVNQFRDVLKKQNANLFYTAKHKNEISSDCSDLLKELRSGGICILDGEIEGLCRDRSVLGSGKLKLHHVFSFRGRLHAGENVESLFDTSQLKDFTDKLFK